MLKDGHTHTHARTHTRTRARTHARAHAHTHARTHTHTHTHAQTHRHTDTHRHTHTLTLLPVIVMMASLSKMFLSLSLSLSLSSFHDQVSITYRVVRTPTRRSLRGREEKRSAPSRLISDSTALSTYTLHFRVSPALQQWEAIEKHSLSKSDAHLCLVESDERLLAMVVS